MGNEETTSYVIQFRMGDGGTRTMRITDPEPSLSDAEAEAAARQLAENAVWDPAKRGDVEQLLKVELVTTSKTTIYAA